MMKFFWPVLIVLINLGYLSGQNASDSIPLHKYKFSAEIAAEIATGEMRVHRAAQYYSYIGDYSKALSVPNDVKLEWGFDTLTAEDQAYFKQFSPLNAVNAIIERSKEEQIIILNEAHHKPVHRVFTRKLLKGLYENGYRYFGLEALSNCDYVPPQYCDSQLNERGYPLNSPLSGTYVTEPQMANLITEASTLGFEIFAYEKFGKERELSQATYIAKILEKDPTAKILVHCGWYHLLEAENNGKKWMASYLKEKTGVDPLTIYQDILIERYSAAESPFFQMMDYQEEKVFVDNNGQFYNGKKAFNLFDVLVYHPRTRYIFNRPDWLVKLEGHHLFTIENINIEYPCIIKAYRKEAPTSAVPIDIIEKEYEADPTALVLPKGDFRLEIGNRKGEKEVQLVRVE
jgi:hypothetical protein